jgi:hypothetical protein
MSFYVRCIEDTDRESQDGMQPTSSHQFATNKRTGSRVKQSVVWQYHCGAAAARRQAEHYMLKES